MNWSQLACCLLIAGVAGFDFVVDPSLFSDDDLPKLHCSHQRPIPPGCPTPMTPPPPTTTTTTTDPPTTTLPETTLLPTTLPPSKPIRIPKALNHLFPVLVILLGLITVVIIKLTVVLLHVQRTRRLLTRLMSHLFHAEREPEMMQLTEV